MGLLGFPVESSCLSRHQVGIKTEVGNKEGPLKSNKTAPGCSYKSELSGDLHVQELATFVDHCHV